MMKNVAALAVFNTI